MKIKFSTLVLFFIITAVQLAFPQAKAVKDSSSNGPGDKVIKRTQTFEHNSERTQKKQNPVYETYPNIGYFGFLIDTKASDMGKGGFGFYFGYKRYLGISDIFGINVVSSFTYFLNDSQSDNFVNTSIPHNYYTLTGVENNASFTGHIAPSLVFDNNLMLYGGIGFNYLNGREFAKSDLTGLYWTSGSENSVLFSQIAGLEFSPASNKLVLNLEYNRTEKTGYVSLKAGVHF